MTESARSLTLAAILIIGGLAAGGCRGGESSAAAPKGGGGGKGGQGGGAASLPIKPVHLIMATERSVTRLVTAPGTLAADEQISLGFKVAGRVSRLSIDLGSLVRKGQVIAQLETEDFKSRVTQAEAALQQARVRLGLPSEATDDPNDNRIRIEDTALVRSAKALMEQARLNRDRAARLVREGVQAQAELDRTNSELRVAESRYQDAIEEVRNRQAVLAQRRSELELARQQLSYTTLYAPSDGAVREKKTSVGEYLAAGTPVATLVRLHPLRMRVEVPEREAHGIRVGLPVKVTVNEVAGDFAGRVVRLSPAIQEQSRTLVVEAEVDNQQGKLRPGAFAKAEIQTSTSNGVITIPPSAVVTFAGIQKVYVVKDGKALEKPIVTGRREADWVEVTEGLEAGEAVVDAPGNLVTGQPVNAQE
ncbi:MAG TPA: efflux RND transporter periplasmic adaptor subunit [Blastocatellia bacterium]|nr:efflux RND transporter periplasmic adaptor subunit [Blastocatellia bacterium]